MEAFFKIIQIFFFVYHNVLGMSCLIENLKSDLKNNL